MMRRGMTLIEMLASLALLAILTASLAGWCTWAARTEAELAPRLHAESAARSVLRLIQNDLSAGDFGIGGDEQQDRDDRVDIEPGELRVHTRDGGSVLHTYRLEPERDVLVRLSTRPDGSSTSRILMENVQSFDCAIDAERHELTITIKAPATPRTPGTLGSPGTVFTRTCRIE